MERGRVHPFIPHCGRNLFFISLYGLTTVNMCIKFKIAYNMFFIAESCVQDLQIFRALP